jgi:Tol biopolymer transport system component
MNHKFQIKGGKVAVVAFASLIAVIGLMGMLVATQQPVLAHSALAPQQPAVITDTIAYSRVVSATSSHEVRFVNVDGTSDISITTGWRPRISPDDHFISFNRDGAYPNGTGDNIYVKDLATQVVTRVVNNTDYIVSTNWSTDSQHIFLDASCAIYRINQDGSNVINLTSNHNCWDDAPSMNPVSGLIAFHNQFSGLYTMNADGSNIQHIPNTQANDWWTSWSKDGQWLSFLRGANYYKIRPNGTGLTQLTFSTAVIASINDYNPNVPWSGAPWSSDDSSVIAPRTVNGIQGIYAIAADGSGAMTLVLPSPAGTWVDSVGTVVGNPVVIRQVYLPLIMQ